MKILFCMSLLGTSKHKLSTNHKYKLEYFNKTVNTNTIITIKMIGYKLYFLHNMLSIHSGWMAACLPGLPTSHSPELAWGFQMTESSWREPGSWDYVQHHLSTRLSLAPAARNKCTTVPKQGTISSRRPGVAKTPKPRTANRVRPLSRSHMRAEQSLSWSGDKPRFDRR